MPSINVEVQLSSEQLFQAVEQLTKPNLEQFLAQLVILHTHKKAASLFKNEAKLFLKTHENIIIDNNNYEKLIDNREVETLTKEEYQALLYLGEQIDKLQAQRIEYMAELAKIHGISLTKLMEKLGLE
ncbi:STAS/SEC14 domain-containing protein [Dolichospermum sp. ST_con]|nr:STAS/SEC14 domain-containing protein [Dolichospermum sp. ST_con]MDD1418590.1 STAS/SEC14 domain-containing protein [Dolichospermum sp. ST_sed1]MDD1424567.1 STAS/SEC14 domain-containing protein [Dolichospermum sp. ST_sed9]MDD1431079.1 STAS/SEC14 domain-containing protein [Dolichospermum sp. ST_sed6]MDD1434910.1 STAS/SEC14 domain-containing protein [Dolichospermum sp. ST_sed10]MDD1441029.1 STAS/SEC14 domain-containing protein [Dolichospermum sp. ST_sed3]MDD1447188.1 STAS/SEC14 domain-containi